jgi:AcrR family transcriptional regulator
MGMTPHAIYTYYDTRDALISDLIADVYNGVADALEAALTGAASDGPAAQVLAVAAAYRDWAVASPAQFQLVYGNPVPGYRRPPGGPATEAEHRACFVLLTLVSAAWPTPQAREPHDWNEFRPAFAAAVRAGFPGLPPAAVAVALRLWGHMHGLVALEVYGHLDSQVVDPAELYYQEMLDLARSLGPASRDLQVPDHVGVRGHVADVVGYLPDGPGDVVRARVEDSRFESAEPGLVTGGEPGQPASGLVEVHFCEPGEVSTGRDHPPVPLVGQDRPARQAALDLAQVIKEVISTNHQTRAEPGTCASG